MDSETVSALYLIPGWLERLVEECDANTPDDETKMHLLKGASRRLVWNISALLGVNKHGIPGTACRLVERYIYAIMSAFIQYTADSENGRLFMRHLRSRLLLVVASCVQLAAKMCCSATPLTAKLVRDRFLTKGYTYTLNDVIKCELKVFKSLGYKIPVWSALDAAKLLTVKLQLGFDMMEGVELILNLAEYRRDELDRRVRNITMISPSTSAARKTLVRTLHLAAGAVSATARFVSISQEDPISRLANLVNAPCAFIKTISDIILNLVFEGEIECSTVPKKRKLY